MHKLRLKVLAIDDDRADLRLLERHLAKLEEWEVAFVGCRAPEECISRLGEVSPDVILVDYVLEGETGLEVMRRVRELDDRVPVIMLTGQGSEQVAAEVMRCGADDYIVKGELSPAVLQKAFQNALDRLQRERNQAIAEEEKRQRLHMASISHLAAGLAHDLNNMLMGAVGNLELALGDIGGGEVKEEVQAAMASCASMAELIGRLQGFVRGDAAECVGVAVHDVVNRVQLVLRHIVPEGISFQVEPAESALIVRGNNGMLQQILLNLCLNAIEAMPDGGDFTIRAKRVSFPAEAPSSVEGIPDGDYALIEVVDTGVGIEEDVLPRIFEPFFTTKSLDTQRGVGLGLAIVWNSVEFHDGHIRVKSVPGQGTTVCVYIPLAVSGTETSSTPSRKRSTIPAKILLVDDEGQVRRIATKMLERIGYTIVGAANGDEALQVYEASEAPFDAVILDISMPGMSGLECFQRIRTINPSAKVLFSSGHDMGEVGQKLLDEGAKGFLQKPYKLKELEAALLALFD